MFNEREKLKKYGLELQSFDNVVLKHLYPQPRPNEPLTQFYTEPTMIGSPHYEIASLFFKKGEEWLREHYEETRYSKMLKAMDKPNFPEKIISLSKSLEKGYLQGDHKEDYIVILNEPFAHSRYGRKDVNLSFVPEVWSGHHRVGILLALGYDRADVLVAKDLKPGSKLTDGKIHKYCLE